MPLSQHISVDGDTRYLRVGATDVADSSTCGRFLGLKIRPRVKSVDGWTRLWAPWGDDPFPLRDVLDLIIESHTEPTIKSDEGFRSWLRDKLDGLDVHRLVRPFIEHAVENVLNAHESIEQELGPMRLLKQDPEIGPPQRRLWTWGPLYDTKAGTREIRRIRLNSPHTDPNNEDMRWTATAAFVAAQFGQSEHINRVRVVEIGCNDGEFFVAFDGTPAAAREQYFQIAHPRVLDIIEADNVSPCRSCGECKTAGSCGALTGINGMLGQSERGFKSRSVSSSELEIYRQCPGKWLLKSHLHLPQDEDGPGEAALRGLAVHRWLEAAHQRGVGCELKDLPVPGTDPSGTLTDEEYAVAYPFLVHHVQDCPLHSADAPFIVETTFYGYDHDAEAIVAIRPDLIYQAGHTLTVRELKTSGQPYPGGQNEAYDRHLQVPLMLTFLASGLLERFDAKSAAVELELLTPTERFVWKWTTDDSTLLAVAYGDVRRAVEDWHTDDTWETRPGAQCSWCPVQKWCPDRDLAPLAPTGHSDLVGSPTSSEVDDDPPPF